MNVTYPKVIQKATQLFWHLTPGLSRCRKPQRRQERRLLAVGSRPLILIEAPSSAYHSGMLSLGNNHSHEEETSCASTPRNTHFTAASTCMPAPCTSVS